MTHHSDVHRPREEATAVTPTTPCPEDPPGSSLPLGRLTSPSVAVHSAGLSGTGVTAAGTPAPDTRPGPYGTPDPFAAPDASGAPDARRASGSYGTPDAHGTPDPFAAPDASGAPDARRASGSYGTPGPYGTPDPFAAPDASGAPDARSSSGSYGTPDVHGSAGRGAPTEAGLPAPAQEPPSDGPSGAGPGAAVPREPGATATGDSAGPRPEALSDAAGTATKTVGARDTAPATERFERQFSGAGGRRTVVIGTETTGAIPVHLLYRDAVASVGATARGAAEKTETGRRTDAASGAGAAPPLNGTSAGGPSAQGASGTGTSSLENPDGAARNEDRRSAFGVNGLTKDADGDGGPDTIAMPPVAPTGRRSTPGAGQSTRRPAPPPDPRLIERPGPVLPGWAALLAGVISLVACAGVLHWAGAFPPEVTTLFGLGERPYGGLGFVHWGVLAVSLTLALFSLGGLARGRVGHAWVLTLYGEYRGSVRSSGLMWVSPLLLRRRVDVRLRHWRSDPMPAVDAEGTALEAVVLVVWRVRDTARAVLGVANHEAYLREQVEAALARVLSQLPADASAPPAGGGPALELRPTLRNAEAVGDALTKTLAAECAPIGIDVFSAQPTRIEYAPEVAAAMRRRRVAALEAERRDTVLSSVVDAVDDTVQRLTMRGLVEFDDYERKALVRDLTVAFCTARTSGAETP
ncbi:SPFH domain-containing protein [Streptomyces sp. NPDC007883]|uniref:SPFH domain-containing protein n=1 Tax=Streptomyces sp. NPDC007883 TaxID=3155116 RepID=UPI0033E81C30